MRSWLAALMALVVGLVLYGWQLNRVLSTTPRAARKYIPSDLTAGRIRATFERVQRDGIPWKGGLPPRKERRYIVVGGSGAVGGQIVVLLLANGTPPEAIRMIDARAPVRAELLAEPAASVPFIAADISSAASVSTAFAAPWPSPSVARLPLTVFHTAAIILPAERSPLVYEKLARVNVAGTAHVLSATREAGAGVLVATSSSIVGLSRVGWIFPPWRAEPHNYAQFISEADFFGPARGPAEMATNYARSKCEAERLVCGADEGSGGRLRTGTIRPGNGVYGTAGDHILGRMISTARMPTWTAPWVQNWVHAGNAALAHLLYEDALLGRHADAVGGRPYLVTDDGPPLRFSDLYRIIQGASVTEFVIDYPPPLVLLLLAYGIEAYCDLLARFSWLKRWLPELQDPLNLLQPGCFDSAVTCILDDSAARRAPEQGGIGYRPCCTTLEGMCAQIAEWNESVAVLRKREREARTEAILSGHKGSSEKTS